MLRNLKLSQKGVLLVAVPLIVSLAFIGTLALLLNQARDVARKQVHAKAVIEETNTVRGLLDDAAANMGGYVQTRSLLWNDRYEKAVTELKERLPHLKQLLASDPERSSTYVAFEQDLLASLDLLREAKQAAEEGPEDLRTLKAERVYRGADITIRKVRDQLAKIPTEEEKRQPAANVIAEDSVMPALFGGMFIYCVLAAGMAAFFSKGITSRFKLLRDNSVRVASGAELNPRIQGNDEIAELDSAFHKMVASLSEARQKERAIVENAVDVICSIDNQGRFAEVSPSSGTAWGYPPGDLIGQRLVTLVLPEFVDETLKAMERRDEKAFSFENKIKRGGGGTIDLLWSGSRTGDALYLVAHDVTERKKIEQLKREFVAMVSHDLRTPLTSVQCFLEMLGEGMLNDSPDTMQNRAKSSQADISRLINLVNSLLDIDKMEAGKLEISPSLFPIKSLVERSVGSVRTWAERSGIKLEGKAVDGLMFADEDRLVQVLINLISNAVKFSPRDSTVCVTAENLPDCIELKVIDSGRGIPESHRTKIFDRFEQVELDDSRLKGGTGLGLAICKAIVTAHGGTIGVDSVEGKGSTFWFRIPKVEDEDNATT